MSAVTVQLPTFSRIQVCAPFNLVVAPNASYSISAVAESQVLEAISATVSNGTLDIETIKSFETKAPIKVQASLGLQHKILLPWGSAVSPGDLHCQLDLQLNEVS